MMVSCDHRPESIASCNDARLSVLPLQMLLVATDEVIELNLFRWRWMSLFLAQSGHPDGLPNVRFWG